jgi:hypothetical protein
MKDCQSQERWPSGSCFKNGRDSEASCMPERRRHFVKEKSPKLAESESELESVESVRPTGSLTK